MHEHYLEQNERFNTCTLKGNIANELQEFTSVDFAHSSTQSSAVATALASAHVIQSVRHRVHGVHNERHQTFLLVAALLTSVQLRSCKSTELEKFVHVLHDCTCSFSGAAVA